MKYPKKPGPHIFKGIRRSSTGRYITSLHEFVNVKRDFAYDEWLITRFGSGKQFPLSSFEGDWEEIDYLLEKDTK